MPWHIIENDGKYCVAKEGMDKPILGGCHPTRAEAEKHMAAMYANMPAMEKGLDETLVAYGDAIKALGGGKVGGYLVRHSTASDPDATNDYFDAKTDLGEPNKLPLLYHHGLDLKIGKRRIGTAETKRDDAGLWAEAQLNLRDEYEKHIYAMAEAGKLGWSSGAAAHAVVRERGTKANHITQWYIAEASLTPTPAEWRNNVIPLKSLLTLEAEPEATKIAAQAESEVKNSYEVRDMTPEETKALIEKTNAEKEAATKAAEDAKKAKEKADIDTKTALEAQVKASVESALKAQKDAEAKAEQDALVQRAVAAALKGVIVPESGVKSFNTKKVTDRGFADDEMKSFFHWIRTGDATAYKAAMQGQTDSEGGYAVPDDFYNQVVAKRNQVSIIRQMGVVSFPTSLDRVLIPTEGTAATKYVVTAEEGSYDENEPTLSQAVCTIYKLTKLIKISEELEADAKANFGAWLANVWGRAQGLAENYYFFNVAANGTSQPQSVTYASTLGNTAASQTATTAAELLALIYAMPSEYSDNLKLVMRRSTLGAIRAIASSSVFTFMPMPQGTGDNPNTSSGQAGWLHNIPVYLTDDLPAQAAATKHIVLFNPDFYFVGEREGLTVSRNPWLYQATGQIGLFSRFREGGVATQTAAILHLISLA